MYGAGVYLTSLDPVSHSKEEIAGAAWGDRCRYQIYCGGIGSQTGQ